MYSYSDDFSVCDISMDGSNKIASATVNKEWQSTMPYFS